MLVMELWRHMKGHFWVAFWEQCALRRDVKKSNFSWKSYIFSFCVACMLGTFWLMPFTLVINLPWFLSLRTLYIQVSFEANSQISSKWLFCYKICPQMFPFSFYFIDTGIFSIYNEDSKLCAEAQNSSAVITTTCDEHNKFQKFRWVSATQLLSVALKLCLGVLTKNDEAAITLESCNRTNELLLWECRNETLATYGKDLFFNYGKGKGKKIRLSKGSGKGSRWKIHGTAANVCSQHYEGEYWKSISISR